MKVMTADIVAVADSVSAGSPSLEARLARLFDAHHQRLYRLARRLCPNAEDARDLIQDTYLRAAQKLTSVPIGPAAEEARRSRALTPHVGTWVGLAGDERLGVRARAAAERGPAAGSFAADGERLLLGCTPGALEIEEAQPAGGRWMAAAEYLRGRGLPVPAE